MNANLRNFALWVIIVLLLLALFTLFQNPGQRTPAQDISFSQLLNEVDQSRVRDVLIQGPEIHGTFTDGRSFQTYAPNDPNLIQRLYGKGVSITARPSRTTCRGSCRSWSRGSRSSRSSESGYSSRGRCKAPAARRSASARRPPTFWPGRLAA